MILAAFSIWFRHPRTALLDGLLAGVLSSLAWLAHGGGGAEEERIARASGEGGEESGAGGRGDGRSMTTRQYARLVSQWIARIGLDPHVFGTHSLRRTKATLIYRRTGNLRAVQLLLGHTKIESTVRYLGIEIDDAIAIAEQVDV